MDFENVNLITVKLIKNRMKEKLADEIEYFENNGNETLKQLIFYIRCFYMIDNVINIVEGMKNKVDFEQLESSCDPIGWFSEISSMKIAGDDFASLYEIVLMDCPIGFIFLKYIEINNPESLNFNHINTFFKEKSPEEVRSGLKKILLDELYYYIEGLGDISKGDFKTVLETEADLNTIKVIYNSLGEIDKIKKIDKRVKLCPSFGNLYPLFTRQLYDVDNIDRFKQVLCNFYDYNKILSLTPDPTKREEMKIDSRSLEDYIYILENRIHSLTFDQQCNLTCFYSYIKLKEQEIKNITWLSELISRKIEKQNSGWKNIIIPFDLE